MTKLKKLVLQKLPCLRTIWKGIVSPLSLLNLKEILLQDLDGLNFMFSIDMAERLQQLKELSILNCKQMVQIIVNDHHDIERECKMVFPQLTNLKLCYLPNLSMVTKGVLRHGWPSLETMIIVKCINLKRLPMIVSPETKLEKIVVEEEWFHRLEWDDQTDDKLHLQERVKVIFVKSDKTSRRSLSNKSGSFRWR